MWLLARQNVLNTMRATSTATRGVLRAGFGTKANHTPMLCYQCEQTKDQTGCTTVGVCGKTPEVAGMQDLLVHSLKGLSQYAYPLSQHGIHYPEIDQFPLEALFTTLTNVNFDQARFRTLLTEVNALRDKAKKSYELACETASRPAQVMTGPATFRVNPNASTDELQTLADSIGLQSRMDAGNKDIVGLQELIMYGLKGTAAYATHAMRLGHTSQEVFDFFHEALNWLTTDAANDVGGLLGLALRVGEINFKVMGMLEEGHIGHFGNPEPTELLITAKKGKCILVSGHDLHDLEALLKATEGKGINVYTHGEMLPASAYPGLKKYKHLVGNYGGAWQLQKFEFGRFPGAILITSNCLVEPRPSYADRLFTTGPGGWPGITHLKHGDYQQVIEKALAQPGFDEDEPAKHIPIGFGKNVVLSNAGTIIGAIQAGAIKDFYVIGGCDGAEGERSYFKKLATSLGPQSVILTLGCGKYRFNKLDFGTIGDSGIPRMLDMGQCNDAYGALQVAIALAGALKTDVNSLPINYAISWFEQKAVAVLLTMLHLGVKRIHLGPHLPAFVPPSALDILVKTFELSPISTPEKDFKL